MALALTVGMVCVGAGAAQMRQRRRVIMTVARCKGDSPERLEA
jgi:hypothetical protein